MIPASILPHIYDLILLILRAAFPAVSPLLPRPRPPDAADLLGHPIQGENGEGQADGVVHDQIDGLPVLQNPAGRGGEIPGPVRVRLLLHGALHHEADGPLGQAGDKLHLPRLQGVRGENACGEVSVLGDFLPLRLQPGLKLAAGVHDAHGGRHERHEKQKHGQPQRRLHRHASRPALGDGKRHPLSGHNF